VARIAQEHATSDYDLSFGASQTVVVMLTGNSLNSTSRAAPTISQLSDNEEDCAPEFPNFRVIDFWAVDSSQSPDCFRITGYSSPIRLWKSSRPPASDQPFARARAFLGRSNTSVADRNNETPARAKPP